MDIYRIASIEEAVQDNDYVGRGILLGRTRDGSKAVFAYFIMGRSANSRNRIFRAEGDDVTIYPYDASKVEDPTLIIYSPVRKAGSCTVVTNGDQTDTVCEFLARGESFEDALRTRKFEHDAPNYTPRISGILYGDNGYAYKLNILKSADAEGSACFRQTFEYEPVNGLGHFLHTYRCNGNPIPTFTGEPECVAIPDTADEMTERLWNALNAENRISLCVRYIDTESGAYEQRIINKFGPEAGGEAGAKG